MYKPDLVVYGPGRVAAVRERLDAPPDLVVDVPSAATKALDLITKRDDYEAFGVGAYWAVDPEDVSARVWRRDGGRLLEAGVQRDVVECGALPGLRVDLEMIRRELPPRTATS